MSSRPLSMFAKYGTLIPLFLCLLAMPSHEAGGESGAQLLWKTAIFETEQPEPFGKTKISFTFFAQKHGYGSSVKMDIFSLGKLFHVPSEKMDDVWGLEFDSLFVEAHGDPTGEGSGLIIRFSYGPRDPQRKLILTITLSGDGTMRTFVIGAE